MPLLTCPNDNAPMQPVRREGVEIDVCTQCRGVWLDRGELEKLLSVVRDADGQAPVGAGYTQQQRPPQAPYQQGYGERGERGEQGEYGERGSYGQQGQRRRFGLFDIFD